MCDLNLALATDPGNNAECTHFIISMLVGLIAAASAHSNLIWPKPRNAIDTFLPEWSGGKAPTTWEDGENPCACINGTGQACDIGQTCLWFSVGCGIGWYARTACIVDYLPTCMQQMSTRLCK